MGEGGDPPRPRLEVSIPSRPPLRILHLLGNREDHGGILSVVRSLQAATRDSLEHVVWVHRDFVARRSPDLDLRVSSRARDESASHLRLLVDNLLALPGLLRLLRQEPFGMVHGHTRGAFPLCVALHRFSNHPVLFTNHTYARRVGMYRRAARNGLPMVLLTPTMARHYGLEPNPGRIEIISACCDDAWFARPLPSRPPVTDARTIRLVGIGNVARWKNWHHVVEALAKVPAPLRPRLRFELWGPVAADADAQAYSRELGERIAALHLEDQVHLAGPTRDVPAVLAGADAVLVASTNEPCSVALIEALASGVPALATDSGGNLDILQDGRTGLLFPPGDTDALAQRLTELAGGTGPTGTPAELRASVAARSASAVARHYLTLYQQLAAAPA